MRITLRKSSPLFTSLVVLGVFVGVMVCGPLLSKAHAPVDGNHDCEQFRS